MRTPRENLLSVFRHEVPEWIPVAAHVDPYNQPSREGMDPQLAEQFGDVQWANEATVLFSRYLGLDIMDLASPPMTIRRQKVTVESEVKDDLRITTWHTPKGDLRQVDRLSADTGMWYTIEHQVKEAGDLPLLAAVFADQEFVADPEQVTAMQVRKRLIGDDGIITFAMTGTPLGQMVRVHAGVENTGYLWADARRELHDLFAVMEESHLRQYRLASSFTEADALVGMDDTSTTTLSPAMFEEYCLGYTDHVADAVHAQHSLYFHHSCGLIHDLLPLYRQTRMDAVHFFNIPPMGDVTIAQGRELLGSKITIIPLFVQLFGGMEDREAVADSVAAMFREAAPGDHFLPVVIADPGKTMEETAFIVDICKQYQRPSKGDF